MIMKAIPKQTYAVPFHTKTGHRKILPRSSPPAALPLLEEIAQEARRETRRHFGNSINMFTPLYIANYCEKLLYLLWI